MPASAIEQLSSQPDTTRVNLQPGQVLIYREHLAPGIFVIEGGALEARADGARSGRKLARSGTEPPVLVVPHPGQLADRSPSTVVVTAAGTALFVPRSAIAADPGLAQLLESLAGAPTDLSHETAP